MQDLHEIGVRAGYHTTAAPGVATAMPVREGLGYPSHLH
jgi:hypothetical protein